MVQKSGVHQLRLVVYPSIFKGAIHPWWLFGISEPSTESYCLSGTPGPHDSTQIFACGANLQCCHAWGMEVVAWKWLFFKFWVTWLLSGSPKKTFQTATNISKRLSPKLQHITTSLYEQSFKNPINIFWLVVSTHLKNISQIGSFPQVGMKIKNIWVATTKSCRKSTSKKPPTSPSWFPILKPPHSHLNEMIWGKHPSEVNVKCFGGCSFKFHKLQFQS